jgi:hypothetical protein
LRLGIRREGQSEDEDEDGGEGEGEELRRGLTGGRRQPLPSRKKEIRWTPPAGRSCELEEPGKI